MGSPGSLRSGPGSPPKVPTETTMAKHTIYCTHQSRHDGERVEPGKKLVVDDSEMTGLMSSGRFVTEERWNELKEEREAAAKKAEKAAPKEKAEAPK